MEQASPGKAMMHAIKKKGTVYRAPFSLTILKYRVYLSDTSIKTPSGSDI